MIGAGSFTFSNDSITIGKNVIIGANATVTKSIPDNSVVVGSNKIIKFSEKEMKKKIAMYWA